IEAIHRISVTKSVALSSITPFLTLVIAWVVLGLTPNLWQVISLVPLTIGVLLLTGHLKRIGPKSV
ncbi:MAG: EamA family transporter, partial [bacterium]|nr:EamA family transporter [bacterium]